MTDEQFQEFCSLWSSDAKNYVLVNVRPTNSDLQHCVVFNRQTRSAKLIPDAALALEVMQRMVDAGVEIVDQLPKA